MGELYVVISVSIFVSSFTVGCSKAGQERGYVNGSTLIFIVCRKLHINLKLCHAIKPLCFKEL